MAEPLPRNPLQRISAAIDRVNDQIAERVRAFAGTVFGTERFSATKETILAVEGIVFVSVGTTLMQIAEWFFAVIAFGIMGLLLFAKALATDHWLKKLAGCTGAAVLSGGMIAIAVLHKPDSDPWSNLQKLWQGSPMARVTVWIIDPPKVTTAEVVIDNNTKLALRDVNEHLMFPVIQIAEPDNPNRVHIINGGANADFVNILIPDLEPGEMRVVRLKFGMPGDYVSTGQWRKDYGYSKDTLVFVPGELIKVGPEMSAPVVKQ